MQCPDSKPLATPIPKLLCLFIMVKSKSAAGPDGRAAAMTSLRKTKPGPKPKVRMNSKKGKKTWWKYLMMRRMTQKHLEQL